MSVDHLRANPNATSATSSTSRLGRMSAAGAPVAPIAADSEVPPRRDARPLASALAACFPKPVPVDRTVRIPQPAAFVRADHSSQPARLDPAGRPPQPAAPPHVDRPAPTSLEPTRRPSQPAAHDHGVHGVDSRAPGSFARSRLPPRSPAAALAASGGTLLFGAVTRLRPSATPGIRANALAAPMVPAARARAAAGATSGARAADAAISPGDTVELSSEVLAALVAETMTLKPTVAAPPRAASAAVPAAPTGAAAMAHAASASSAAVTLTLPRSAVQSRRRGPTQPAAHADVTAPGLAATPVDLTSIWWSAPPSPPHAPQYPTTPPSTPLTTQPTTPFSSPPSPWSWRCPRPPRIGLVIFLLIASLLGGLLAPACWIAASTELDGIQQGRVEDHHRGLLALARRWGLVVTCLLAALAFYMLFHIAQVNAHGH